MKSANHIKYSHNVITLCIRIWDTFTFICTKNSYGYDKTNVGIMKGPCPLEYDLCKKSS